MGSEMCIRDSNKTSSSGTYHSKEVSLIKTKLCQARPTKYNHGMRGGPDGCIIKGIDIKLCQARPKTNKNFYNVLQIVYKTITESPNYATKSRLRHIPTHLVMHQDRLERKCRSNYESILVIYPDRLRRRKCRSSFESIFDYSSDDSSL